MSKMGKTYILFLLVFLHVQITQSKFCQSTGNGSSHKEFSIQQILTQGRPVGQNNKQICIQINNGMNNAEKQTERFFHWVTYYKNNAIFHIPCGEAFPWGWESMKDRNGTGKTPKIPSLVLSLLPNPTETLATQATFHKITKEVNSHLCHRCYVLPQRKRSLPFFFFQGPTTNNNNVHTY